MWVPHDVRDAVMDFVNDWSSKAQIPTAHFIRWLDVGVLPQLEMECPEIRLILTDRRQGNETSSQEFHG